MVVLAAILHSLISVHPHIRLLLLGLLAGLVVPIDRFPLSRSLGAQHPMQARPILSATVSESRNPQSVGLPEGRLDMQLPEVRQPTTQITDESIANSRNKMEYFAIVVGGAMGLAVLLLIVVLSSTKREPPL